METFARLSTLLFAVLVILAILIPFFILRIRNEVIQINEKLEILISLKYPDESESPTVLYRSSLNAKGRKIKICSKCGGKNRFEDSKCVHCSEPLY